MVVLGGGVIGCSIAYHLVRTGARVVLLERGRLGDQASGAAAGLLVPLSEAQRPGPFLDLGMESAGRYAAFAQELLDASGIDIELVRAGLLRLAVAPGEVEELKSRPNWQRPLEAHLSWVDAEQAHRLEPALGPEVRGALEYRDQQHLSPPKLVAALARAAARAGVDVREGAEAMDLLREKDHVRGVRLAEGEIAAGHVVLAAGAWVARIGQWLGAALPVFPVRGQILALRPSSLPLSRIIFSSLGYLVGKPDGTLWVGATEETAGYEAQVTPAGLSSLLSAAMRLVPALAEAPFLRAWAGLRPATPDRLPLLGPVPGWEQVSVAAGHFRSGVLLAPVTGLLMAEYVSTGRLPAALRPFDPARFTPVA